MSTLKELIEGRELPVKVYNIKGDYPKCFEIVYVEQNTAFGFFDDGYPASRFLNSDAWELYEEPKKKVKVALYAYKNESSKYWMVTDRFFKDNNEFNDNYYSNKFKRLDWSEIEVNDE